MDLIDWTGYSPSKPGYRHHDFAVVGWLDGHVKAHKEVFVQRRQELEEGMTLFGNEQLVHWNRY